MSLFFDKGDLVLKRSAQFYFLLPDQWKMTLILALKNKNKIIFTLEVDKLKNESELSDTYQIKIQSTNITDILTQKKKNLSLDSFTFDKLTF